MSTLLEAAKAVRNWLRPLRDGVLRESPFEIQQYLNSEGNLLLRLENAIAAEEQRLADEQLPATKEWLEELLRLSSKRYASLGVYGWFRHGIKLAIHDNGSIEAADSVAIETPTRRQAMALLEAMGVKP